MRIRAAFLTLLAILAFAPAVATAAEPVKVVATFSILGDMVGRIGGERVSVATLVGPDGDAHVYEPTPADAKAVRDADLVVENGLGFEGFIERLLGAAEYAGPVVVATARVTPRKAEGEEGEDPHAWQDVSNAVAYVDEIESGLCAADADGCPDFRVNADAYRAELRALDEGLRERIGAIPERNRVVLTSHDAFGYFGRAYGIRFLAPQGVSTDAEASARDVADLIRQIRELGVGVIFVETIADPRLVARIAAETGAAVGPPLYSDALSPAGRGADTYVGMIRHNADAMITAMESGRRG